MKRTGLLEKTLTKLRGKYVKTLIPPSHKKGRILDIGCGTYPFFLLNVDFHEKYGLDRLLGENLIKHFQNQKIYLTNHDIEKEVSLPFDSKYFDIVTMLAVLEHIDEKKLKKMLSEIYRILKYGGLFIITTPAAWTKLLLKIMAKLRLVSPVLHAEHKAAYVPSRISRLLQEANFPREKLRIGYFEVFMNIWATATK